MMKKQKYFTGGLMIYSLAAFLLFASCKATNRESSTTPTTEPDAHENLTSRPLNLHIENESCTSNQEPQPMELTGYLKIGGAQSYWDLETEEEIPGENYYILYLNEPQNFSLDTFDGNNEQILLENIESVHIFLREEYKIVNLDNYNDCLILATGTPFLAHTKYHKRDVIFDATSIESIIK